MTTSSLLWGVLFGSIGLGFLIYGRRQRAVVPLLCGLALASFAGSTGCGYARAAGCSGIWSPAGVVVAQAGPATGAIARATLT